LAGAGALLGSLQAPEAEAGLELATEQEGDDPTTQQEQEFECLGGHQRQSLQKKWGVAKNNRQSGRRPI
jgi:hypothetical protein